MPFFRSRYFRRLATTSTFALLRVFAASTTNQSKMKYATDYLYKLWKYLISLNCVVLGMSCIKYIKEKSISLIWKYRKRIIRNWMEHLVFSMFDPDNGVPLVTVIQTGRRIPSVFVGSHLISWIEHRLKIDEDEALYLANVLSMNGYLFPIARRDFKVVNGEEYYRFQPPFYWLSTNTEDSDYRYAVYLCKRTLKGESLTSDKFQAERLGALRSMFSRRWALVTMQSEAEILVMNRHNNDDKEVLDSQERAFWDLRRPVPGVKINREYDYHTLKRFEMTT